MPVLKPLTALRNRNVLPPERNGVMKPRMSGVYDWDFGFVFSESLPVAKEKRQKKKKGL